MRGAFWYYTTNNLLRNINASHIALIYIFAMTLIFTKRFFAVQRLVGGNVYMCQRVRRKSLTPVGIVIDFQQTCVSAYLFGRLLN